MGEIRDNVLEFYNAIKQNEDHRYKSWEHCHKFFEDRAGKQLSNEDLELAQLHLAFYLASWGMYRGSSFILQKDYTIFKNIMNIIFDKKFLPLFKINKYYNDEDLNDLFKELYTKIEEELFKIKKTMPNHKDLNGKRFGNNISYTLITKILLGCIGCIPAYDRYFKEGLGGEKGLTKEFNRKNSFNEMLNFYKKNRNEIDLISVEIPNYTPMKIIDMYFWKIGSKN